MYSKIKGIDLEVTRLDIVSYKCVLSVPWLSTDGTIEPSPTVCFSFNSAYSRYYGALLLFFFNLHDRQSPFLFWLSDF